MKKIIAILLSLTFIISLSACGKTAEKETATQPPTTETPKIEIVENTEKQPSKYENTELNTTPVKNLFNNLTSDGAEEIKKAYEAINGRIIDAKAVDETVFFLTPSGLYSFHRILFFGGVLQLDIGNNTKIVTAGEDIIILSDDEGNLTIYNSLLGEEGTSDYYEKCTIEELTLDNDDILVGFEQSVGWDDAYILTDVKSSGVTAKIFTQTNPYEIDNTFDYLRTETFEFSSSLNSEIKDIVVSQDMDTSEGFILLENGDLHYFEGVMCTYYKPRQFTIRGDAVKNVKNIWNDRKADIVYVEKEDGKFYKVDFGESDEKWVYSEEVLNLPSEIKSEDIKTFLAPDSYYGYIFIELNNGDIYTNFNSTDIGIFEKHESLSELNRNDGIIKIVEIEGHIIVIADDGNMYELCK